MNRINPNAVFFTAFAACLGAVFGGSHGALIGATVGLGIVVAAPIFTGR